MNGKKYIRQVRKQTVSIPIPKFKQNSEVIARRHGEENIGRVFERFYDIDCNRYRYRIVTPEMCCMYYEYELELKLPQPTNDKANTFQEN
jgi:hypothetical protein